MNKKIPSYEDLFENLDYYSSDESRSVLSPAAYLADIMNLKDWKYNHNNIDEKDAVDDRREDISEILLNAENTFTEIPHLDVANDVMERKVKALVSGADPYDVMRETRFPFNLPFNLHQAEINNILPYFKICPADFYKTFKALPVPETTAKEMLGLSDEDVSVITVSSSEESRLKDYYGLSGPESIQSLAAANADDPLLKFRAKTGLSALQLSELLFQNLSESEKAGHVSRKFFINNSGTDNLAYISTRTITLTNSEGKEVEREEIVLTDGNTVLPGPIPVSYFDRMHRFIRLSMKTGLSFIDLDQILMGLCGGVLNTDALNVVAVVKMLTEKYELKIEEVCALFTSIKDYGEGESTLKGDMFNALFNEGGRLKNISEVATDSHIFRNRVQASIGCSSQEYLEIDEFIGGTWAADEIPERLAIFYRIKKLVSLFDITVGSLLKLFTIIDKNRGLLSSFKFPVPLGFGKLSRTCRSVITDYSGPTNISEKLTLVQLTIVLMEWLVVNEMSVEQLEFICTEHSTGEADGVMSADDRNDLFRDLENQFRGVLLNSSAIQSGITDKNSAERLFAAFSGADTGIITPQGLVRKTVTGNEVLPEYISIIHDILFIETDDLNAKDMLEADKSALELIFSKMKNMEYIDSESFIADNEANIEFFSSSANLPGFIDIIGSGADTTKLLQLVYKAMSDRAVSYKKAKENAVNESVAIAEKIRVCAERQNTVLLRALEIGLGISFDIVKILLRSFFRTSDETDEMAVVRFMAPVFDGIEKESVTAILAFDASLVTSFRRVQQFALLVQKTELKGKELEVLFDIRKVQSSIPEKIKLPWEFQNKIDAMYSNETGDVLIFSGNRYVEYSGLDYSIKGSGSINEITGVPASFSSGVNAALMDQSVNGAERKTYFFAGDKYVDKTAPGDIKDTKTDWGRVRNNVAENSRIDAAYRSEDGKTFLFSGEQYIRYSGSSRDFVDEGYPKNTLKYWNSENQVKLPPNIRARVDSIFNIGTKVYFFSGDKYIEASKPRDVFNTREHLGTPLNNIILYNRVDAAIVVAGKTFLFSGDQYVRYSGSDYSFVDEGYPKKITGNWSAEKIIDLPQDFTTKVDAAFTGSDSCSYFFKGDTFVSTRKKSAPEEVKEKWGKIENNIKLNGKIDAAFSRAGKTYLFSGNQYVRYSGSDYSFADEGYPKKIAGNWNSLEACGLLPESFNSLVSAAMTVSNGSSYVFSGNSYISSEKGSLPLQINSHWGRVKNNIQINGTIDSAFKAPDGKTYIFSGDQYFRYSGTDYQNCDEGYPRKIAGNWGLSGTFVQKIDAAFVFKVDGTDRLYLFSDGYYTRYSNNNYSQPDVGYPRILNFHDSYHHHHHHPEGEWFDPIFECGPDHDIRSMATIFVDRYNDKDRINYFYYDDHGREKLMTYAYNSGTKRWNWSGKTFAVTPFVTVDSGFTGADNQVYLFSGTNYAMRQGDYTGISSPSEVKTKWGRILNNFLSLNRVDSSFQKSDGKTFMFCEDQYIRYSSDINPDDTGFYVDEGYPKKISGNWQNENSDIALPGVFTAEGMALLELQGEVYLFNGIDFISSINQEPLSISGTWGNVKNNFADLNRVDAASVYNNRTYLFSGDQYTRYSGSYDGYADEGYPKKTANAPAEDLMPGMTFFSVIDSLLDGADGYFYTFSGTRFVSSLMPSETVDVRSKFGAVKNNFTATGIVDAADVKTDGTVYLFSGDQYARYSGGSITGYADEGYPKSIKNWKKNEGSSLPVSAEQGIKAMFTDGDGETYLFTADSYFKLSDPETVLPVNSKWGKVKNNIAATGIVDAAFIAPDGKTYLFSGEQYTCYSNGKSDYTDEGFPKLIGNNWGTALPAEFRTGIDAGFVFDGRTYLFKGNKYIRYSDPACLKIDSGYPMEISSKMSELPEFRLDDIRTFQQFKKLAKSFNSPDANILSYFKKSGSYADKLSQLSEVTGWSVEETGYLMQSGAVTSDTLSHLPDISDIQTLSEIKSLFDVSEKMGSSPSVILGEVWNSIYHEIKDLKKGSEMLAGLLKSVTGKSSWKGLDAELHGKMNLARRDALMGYLIHRMEQGSETSWIDNPRDLYEYLLIDVEMGEEATTSRIQEAIMCMQLFYHRMLMNLEELVNTSGDEDVAATSALKEKLLLWWKWMKNYRVWEANRKVFLYPENYIRPELRSDKSPEFKELEEALLQSDVTAEAAEKRYKAYLDKYSEISKLKIAGGYVYQRVLGDPDDVSSTAEAINEKRIFMFGYSNTEPKKYYYMSGDILDAENSSGVQTIDWMPWKELGITIDAEKVYPVFSFNKLFVFWVEVRERDQSSYTSSVGPEKKVTQYDPVIYYSFHNHNGEWTPPQKMFDIGAYVDVKATDSKKLFIEDNKKLRTPEWIPAQDVLKNHATLYVTNPITRSSYTAEEFVYISFEIIYKTFPTFKVEGKFKSNLEFVQEAVKVEMLDKLEKNIQFPVDKFGITPTFSNHWKGFFNDAFSAPWFNFSAEGGNFLLKPAIVIDAPVIKKDKKLFKNILDIFPGKTWPNLPDSGFTDQENRKHLFYREVLTPEAPQYYVMVDADDTILTQPVPVTEKWGKKNIFEWYPHGVECAAVDASIGSNIFILSDGGRYVSYTGTQTDIIDQKTIEETAVTGEILNILLSKVLPSGMLAEPWNLVKESLKDYTDNLQDAFVCGSDLYLVMSPVNGSTGKYTRPAMTDFWREMAALYSDVATTIYSWSTVRSATRYRELGGNRLYLTSGDNVFIRDYQNNKNYIRTVAECTHPDLISPVYDATPEEAVETVWPADKENLAGFIEEFLPRLSGVGKENGVIRFIAEKPAPTDNQSAGQPNEKTYEFTVPDQEKLNDVFMYIIGKIEQTGTPCGISGTLTTIDAAKLDGSSTAKKLYLRSEDTVFTYDFAAASWGVDYFHPDVTVKSASTSGRLPETMRNWSDVAEDFIDYCKSVTKALVWKGTFYLITPRAGGGYEFTSPTAHDFWSAVGETCPDASSLTTIDSACLVHEDNVLKLYVTSLDKVAVFDVGSGIWSCQTTLQRWGLAYDKVNSIIEVKEGNSYKVYLFSGRQYAEKKNGLFVSAVISDRWGTQPNGGGVVDSAFMDNQHRVYLFSGTTFVRYSDVNNRVIDQGYPKDIMKDLSIDIDEVKRQFSADIENVEIKPIKTNTAFDQMVNGEEKFYLFLDIDAVITTYVYRPRWVWQGFWTVRRYGGRWGWYHRWYRSYWGRWVLVYDRVPVYTNVRKSVYIRFSAENRDGVNDYLMDHNYPKNITGNWSGLPGDFNKMITATFEDKETSGGVERKVFYIARSLIDNGVAVNDYIKYTGEENFPREISEEQYEIIRLTSNTSEYFSQKLFTDGLDGLLTLSTQCVDEFPAFESNNDNKPEFTYDLNSGDAQNLENVWMKDMRKDNTIFYNSTFLKENKVPESRTLDFGSINGQYYWELFFHAPFLIAQTFNNAQKFEEGKRWYEYVFNPTSQNEAFTDNGLPDLKPYWEFIPFHKDVANSRWDDLNDARQYKRYLNDPFDPHAIAGLRQIAYRKSIVMNYIDNLIDWGDMLFRQYTRESINEARMLYVLAYDLLGKQPELLGTRKLSGPLRYKDLYAMKEVNAGLIDLENLPSNSSMPLKNGGDNVHGSVLDVTGYFYIPENREFADYWERVIDRLTKIRYSLNIDGVKQSLALYEPLIDPMALVRAAGSGAGLAAALADFRVEVPHYRFTFIMSKARELTSRLTQFGQSLLSALEKKDAEELSLLRNTHEKAIMQLTLDIKNAQLKDSEETLQSLRVNLKSAKTREAHYNMLISSGLSPYEQTQIGLLVASQVYSLLSSSISIGAGIAALVPQVGAFAFHIGGVNFSASAKEISEAQRTISSHLSMAANMSSILGGYHRRGQEWSLQRSLAQCDIESINRQIAGAEIKVNIARLEIETAKRNIKNLESVDTFMKGKFTNAQLYRWMAGKLSGLYFQTYQMALDMAKGAQKSFQFELGLKEKDTAFITSLYWDSLKKGLLAGETLQVDLDRMETAYIERNRRRFEISKSISLAELDPLALINLREKRVTEFSLTEALFDYDFPGHYCRQIKSVSLTFPAIVGPNSNLNATLTQLSHRTLLDPDKGGVEYLLDPDPKTAQPLSIRGDWRVNQQIALSRGVNDSGLFQLNFQDERYLPFEGTGAVSSWRLELNGLKSSFDLNTLSDVIIKVEYTSQQGGDAFGAVVKKKLKAVPSAKLFNIAQDFSAEWNAFMMNPAKGLSVTMTRDMFTDMNGGKVTGLYMLYKVSKEGEDIAEIPMKVNTVEVKNGVPADVSLNISSSGSVWKFVPKNNAEDFNPEKIEDILLVCTYVRKGEF